MNIATTTITQVQHELLCACPSCGSAELSGIYAQDDVPVSSCLLFENATAAAAVERGDIRLTHCAGCGFIFNAAFRAGASEYSERYEETQGFSPTFSRFHTRLAQELIDTHDLNGKEILEVGCGKGEFLLLLSHLGGNNCLGVDPSALPDRIKDAPGAERVTLIRDFFTPDMADRAFDAIICKMTLEHIIDTLDFLSVIREAVTEGSQPLVFFQIPNAMRILTDAAFEDIYYEHCSYFTDGSLVRLFEKAGFTPLRVLHQYEDQYLTIECTVGEPTAAMGPALVADDDRAEIASLAAVLAQRLAGRQAEWAQKIAAAAEAGKKVVMWGSGSKAVAFLSSLPAPQLIDAVVDINPNKQGSAMPGSGHDIIAPSELIGIDPDLVIVMNAAYCTEIMEDLASMGIAAQVVAL
ncbi:class I SAM-dependent methyltransferase [Croceicoccus mobilis]|uniref:NDP-hexose methyltransferase n=1 Tax=Croceicoccus mobilis TaxID=1703339 RepID=A0A916Z300_9SPHN|nr:class I SAM-dependent methyltransferase [Croceicoccus mobilis]GGD72130.1 NDP-hexose methyltransferase [Croceicoccus mobilis]